MDLTRNFQNKNLWFIVDRFSCIADGYIRTTLTIKHMVLTTLKSAKKIIFTHYFIIVNKYHR